jgi:beta-alanine--pyruvate transaminase
MRQSCYDDGILIRGAADTLLLSPPLIITEEQIEAIFAAIRSALQEID